MKESSQAVEDITSRARPNITVKTLVPPIRISSESISEQAGFFTIEEAEEPEPSPSPPDSLKLGFGVSDSNLTAQISVRRSKASRRPSRASTGEAKVTSPVSSSPSLSLKPSPIPSADTGGEEEVQHSFSRLPSKGITSSRSNSSLSSAISTYSTADKLKSAGRSAMTRITNLSRASFRSTTLSDHSTRASTFSFLDEEDPSTRMILQNSSAAPGPVGERSELQCRRLEMMESIVRNLTDSKKGINIKTRTKNFKTYALCSLGSDIVEWLYKNCHFLERWEAIRFGLQMLETGYIIPAEAGIETFEDDSTLYSFQNIYFWPSKNWNPSDLDYATYLLRRSSKGSGKNELSEEEEGRIQRFLVTLERDWHIVLEGVEKHKLYLEKIDKTERRMFQMREAAFWKLHRPLKSTVKGAYTEIEDRKNALEKNHMSDSEFEATLSREKLMAHLERRLYTLQVAFSTNRSKISVASKGLVTRTQVWHNVDPFLNADMWNPFVTDDKERKISEDGFTRRRDKPTKEDVKIWSNSLKDLLTDPMGVEYFLKFLQTEFSSENLKFWLRCASLDNEPTKEEWIVRAKEIYRQFVAPHSEYEINLDAQVRAAVIEKFTQLEELERLKPKKVHDLDVNVFSEAMNRIFILMSKDSYNRFTSNLE